jgi:hypothetical protein
MRWRVVDGAQVHRGGGVYAAGEEFDATADEAKRYDGLIERVDKPKTKD